MEQAMNEFYNNYENILIQAKELEDNQRWKELLNAMKENITFARLFCGNSIEKDKIMISCLMTNLKIATITLDHKLVSSIMKELDQYRLNIPENLILKCRAIRMKQEQKRNPRYASDVYMENELEEIIKICKQSQAEINERKVNKLIGQRGEIYWKYNQEGMNMKKDFEQHKFNDTIDRGGQLWFKLELIDDPAYKETKKNIFQLMVESK